MPLIKIKPTPEPAPLGTLTAPEVSATAFYLAALSFLAETKAWPTPTYGSAGQGARAQGCRDLVW